MNIIDIKKSEGRMKLKRGKLTTCQHLRVEIDEETELVECRDCGKIMSAFNFLVMCANGESRALELYFHLIKEVQKLQRKSKELKTV